MNNTVDNEKNDTGEMQGNTCGCKKNDCTVAFVPICIPNHMVNTNSCNSDCVTREELEEILNRRDEDKNTSDLNLYPITLTSGYKSSTTRSDVFNGYTVDSNGVVELQLGLQSDPVVFKTGIVTVGHINIAHAPTRVRTFSGACTIQGQSITSSKNVGGYIDTTGAIKLHLNPTDHANLIEISITISYNHRMVVN